MVTLALNVIRRLSKTEVACVSPTVALLDEGASGGSLVPSLAKVLGPPRTLVPGQGI